MVTTNLVKWQPDGDSELTAYCDDDDTADEIGPAKWDDTNNRLEINCNAVDSIVRWDDTGNNLESRTTDDGCCEDNYECYFCTDCYAAGSAPCEMYVTISGCVGDGIPLNGTWTLTIGSNPCEWDFKSIPDLVWIVCDLHTPGPPFFDFVGAAVWTGAAWQFAVFSGSTPAGDFCNDPGSVSNSQISGGKATWHG